MNTLLATIDLSPITDGVTEIRIAVATPLLVVIAAGISLLALLWGGSWLVKTFKSYAADKAQREEFARASGFAEDGHQSIEDADREADKTEQ